jgi:hypothetical protein
MKNLLSILILSIALTLNVHGEGKSEKHRMPNIEEVRKAKKAFQEDKELKELLVKVEMRLETLGINKKFAKMIVAPKKGRIKPQYRNKHKARSKNRGGKHKFERRNEGNHGVVVVK